MSVGGCDVHFLAEGEEALPDVGGGDGGQLKLFGDGVLAVLAEVKIATAAHLQGVIWLRFYFLATRSVGDRASGDREAVKQREAQVRLGYDALGLQVTEGAIRRGVHSNTSQCPLQRKTVPDIGSGIDAVSSAARPQFLPEV